MNSGIARDCGVVWDEMGDNGVVYLIISKILFSYFNIII